MFGAALAAAWVPPRLRAHLGRMTFLGWRDARLTLEELIEWIYLELARN